MSALYIHIPFCRKACHYCNFHFSTSQKHQKELIRAIQKELEIRKYESNEPIKTIYFGGGTPSLLTLAEFEDIFKTISKHYILIPSIEITLETNPEDISAEYLSGLKSIGINRLSIGIQTFNDDDLKAMNRAHSSKEALNALENASHYFNNISADLIYGFSNMSLKEWAFNIDTILKFNINHLSAYSLTVESKTTLAYHIKNNIYPPPSDLLASQHYELLIEKTSDFIHYEFSNFGKEGFFSKANCAYWKDLPYIGIGPSAHSFDGISRSWNISNNKKYIDSIHQKILPSSKEVLSKKDKYNERIMIGLRTIWGISLDDIQSKFGDYYLEHLLKNSKRYLENKLLNINENKLVVTSKGFFLVDGISSDLFML